MAAGFLFLFLVVAGVSAMAGYWFGRVSAFTEVSEMIDWFKKTQEPKP